MVEKYLKDLDGRYIRFSDGKRIPLSLWDNDPPDVSSVSIQELVRLLKMIEQPISQHLQEQLSWELNASKNPKSGSEPFHFAERKLEHRLLDFWRWSSSDILGNALRGKLAEYIVSLDLGCNSEFRQEWGAYDLLTPDGIKVEVKSSSYLQSWKQKGLSKIVFGIQPTLGWESATNKRSQNSDRQADIYVFGVLDHKDKTSVDPLNLSQWTFHVLRSRVLDERLGKQKTITLSSLLRLEPITCTYGEIAKSIEQALSSA